MSDLGKVAVKFTADPSGLVAGVNAAVASLAKLEQTAASTSRGVGAIVALKGLEVVSSVFTRMGSAALGIGQSLRSMADEQSRVVEGQLAMSQRVGMTFKELSGLAYAAELANVSIDTVVASSNRADVALSKLQAGSKQATATFANLGLSAESFAGKSAAERFELIAASIAKLPTSMERSSSAMAIFGRGGAALLPLFAQGADYIAEMTKEAEALGLTLTNAQAQAVDDMRDSFERAGLAVAGVVRQVVAFLSPAITNVVNQFTQFIKDAEGAKIGATIGAGIIDGARVLADYADAFVVKIGQVWNKAGEVGSTWADTWDMAVRVGGILQMASAGLNIVVGSLLHAGGELYQRIAVLVDYIQFALRVLSGTSISDAYQKMLDVRAPTEAFNRSLKDSVDRNIEAFKKGLSQTFGDTKAVEQVAGPFRRSLEDGLKKAYDNQKTMDKKTDDDQANRQNAAAKALAERMAEELNTRLKQVRGIDATSQEGFDAFFRWARGDTGNDVQQQQLEELRGIREAVSQPEDAVMVGMEGA